MVMRNFSVKTLRRPVNRFVRRQALQLPLIAATALGCLAAFAVENEAEHVDSGWAVAARPSVTASSKQPEPKPQIRLHPALEHSHVPLFQRPSHSQTAADLSASEESTTTKQGSLRFAVRPDGVEGWRPANRSAPPLHEALEAETGLPQLNAPENANSAAGTLKVEDGAADGSGNALKFGPGLGNATSRPSQPLVPDETSGAGEGVESFEALLGDASSSAAGDTTLHQPIEVESSLGAEDEVTPLLDDVPAQAPKKPSAPPLTKQMLGLRSKVRSVLKGYFRKQLNSRENDPWEVMHGMLAYGVHSRIRQGGPRGEPVTSVGWLCYNKPCKKQTLMYVTPKGELRAKYGVGLQGHLGQLLAMLAQCRVSDDYPIRVGQREFTIKDLIEAEKKTCYPKSELTFKLIALQYYLDLNEKWVNDQGLDWDIPRLIREELAQPIRGAACGGTHRLSSLSLTVKTRVRRGEPLDGEYRRAAEFVKKYHQYAFRLQNRDGSLSTAWFRGRGDDSDINRRIKTTGHILEWLCYSLSDEELRSPQTVAAVSYLANLMYSKYDNEWEVGPMCHATHALLIYDERVFQPFDAAGYEVTYKPKRNSGTATARGGQQRSMRR
jgi:hypothetical protein